MTSGAMYRMVPVSPVSEYNPRQDFERATDVQRPKSMSFTVPEAVKLEEGRDMSTKLEYRAKEGVPDVVWFEVTVQNHDLLVVVAMEIFDGRGDVSEDLQGTQERERISRQQIPSGQHFAQRSTSEILEDEHRAIDGIATGLIHCMTQQCDHIWMTEKEVR
jgi:hypothetical protein